MAATAALLLAIAPWAAAAATTGGECVAPTPLGCFQDPYTDPSGKSHRVLTKVVATADPAMSALKCVSLCCKAGYNAGSIAGLEDGGDCRCDHGFGPYTIPKSAGCNVTCTGSAGKKCGGVGAVSALSITSCPGDDEPWRAPEWVSGSAGAPPALQNCGSEGCTSCPKGDLCCIGKSPDSYKVPGGYGCSPPTTKTAGCASGGLGPNANLPANRCCCGMGPSIVSTTLPNVLVIGDSVSDGYMSFVAKALNGTANAQHGPNNAGGGCADGAAYGALCTNYFIRTPHYELPPWDVITFNYGLHDGADTNTSYLANIESISDELLAAGKAANPAKFTPGKLVYFQVCIKTISFGL